MTEEAEGQRDAVPDREAGDPPHQRRQRRRPQDQAQDEQHMVQSFENVTHPFLDECPSRFQGGMRDLHRLGHQSAVAKHEGRLARVVHDEVGGLVLPGRPGSRVLRSR